MRTIQIFRTKAMKWSTTLGNRCIGNSNLFFGIVVCWWDSRWFCCWLLNYCHTVATGTCWPQTAKALTVVTKDNLVGHLLKRYFRKNSPFPIFTLFSISFCFLPFSKRNTGTKFFGIFYILFFKSNSCFFSRTIDSLEICRWVTRTGFLLICGRVRSTGSTLLSTGYKFAVFTVLYQLFLEGLLVLRKFSPLRGFVRVITRRLVHFQLLSSNGKSHSTQAQTWAYCLYTIFYGFSNSTVFWNNFDMKVSIFSPTWALFSFVLRDYIPFWTAPVILCWCP